MVESSSSLSTFDLDDLKSEPSNYIPEIRRMMFGFGDCSEPLVESATLINDVVQREMKSIVYEACNVADKRDSELVEPEDFLFLLRRDKIKLQRLIKYLDLKEITSSVTKGVKDEGPDAITDDSVDVKKKKSPHHLFMDLIDNTGELVDAKNALDEVKQNRLHRAYVMSEKIDTLHYIKYQKARTTSFANKYSHKFHKWIDPDGDLSISKQSYIIMRYLAYETVAQIMDLVFLVRQDQNKIHGDSLDRLRLSYHNPATYKPYQHGESTSARPVTPGEIHEALRRYWSPQLDSMGPFNRQSMHLQHRKFLAI